MDLNQTRDQMEMFGYTDEGVQQEVDKYVDKDAEPAKDITLMDAAKFVAELTPVIGDAMAAKEVYDELQKDDPNYLLAGALGGAAIIGLVPGIGDAAASAIRAGARKTLDVGKRVEVDPDAVGAMGGNIRLKPKEEVTPQLSNIEYQRKMAEFDKTETVDDWQKNVAKYVEESRDVNPTIRTPELEDSTKDLLDNKITREQHLDNVDKYKPVDPWDALPREPSSKAVVFSLNKEQRKDGHFVLDNASSMGINKSSLKIGDLFNGRLDIPAYNRFDTWIVTGSSKNAEKGKHYAKAIHYTAGEEESVKFISSIKTSEKIGTGEKGKTPYATVQGYIKNLDVNEIRNKATQYLDDPEWTQVGFDPRRQGGFYVRAGENKHVPVREASEVIQIGPLVLAKNAKLDMDYTGYNEGGTAMNEQMELALGGIPDNTVGVDPVSGNEIPLGSSPEEVRDDIPAMLSPGEIVVPADVVKFHGVKLFEELREEAKIGFSEMEADGRIGGQPIDEPSMEDNLIPEEEELLNEILAMEENTGVVEAAAGIYTPPNTSVVTTPTASQVPSTGTPPPSTQQVTPSSTTQQPNSVYGITTASGTPVTANTALVNKQPVVDNVDITNPTSSATTTTTTPQTGMVVEQYVAPDCRRLEVLTLNGQMISTLPADFEVFVKATEESLKRFGCIASDDTTDTTTTDDTTITTTTKKDDDDDDDDDDVVTTDPKFDLTTSKGSEAAADYFTKKSGVDVSDPFTAATNALNAASGSSLFEKGVGVISLALGPVAMLGAGAIQTGSKLDALSTAFANLKMANYLGNTGMAKNIQTEIDKFLAKSPKAVKFLSGLGDLGDKKFDYAMMAATSVNAPSNMALTQDRFATEEAFVSSMNSTANTGYIYDPTAGDDGKGAYVIDKSKTVTIPSSDGSGSITVNAGSAAASASSFTKDDDGSIVFTPGKDTVKPKARPDPPGGGSSGSSAPVGIVGNNDTGSNSLAQNIANWTTSGDGKKYVNGVLVNESSSSSNDSSSSSDDGGDETVICTVYSDTGYLSKDIWNLDKRYGTLVYRNDPELMRGYHVWGVPFANFLRKKTFTSKLFRKIMWPIVKAWAEEMAHSMNPKKYKPNYFGKLIKVIGEPFSRLCALITKIKRLEKGIL